MNDEVVIETPDSLLITVEIAEGKTTKLRLVLPEDYPNS
jgi:hypothetical protein